MLKTSRKSNDDLSRIKIGCMDYRLLSVVMIKTKPLKHRWQVPRPKERPLTLKTAWQPAIPSVSGRILQRRWFLAFIMKLSIVSDAAIWWSLSCIPWLEFLTSSFLTFFLAELRWFGLLELRAVIAISPASAKWSLTSRVWMQKCVRTTTAHRHVKRTAAIFLLLAGLEFTSIFWITSFWFLFYSKWSFLLQIGLLYFLYGRAFCVIHLVCWPIALVTRPIFIIWLKLTHNPILIFYLIGNFGSGHMMVNLW